MSNTLIRKASQIIGAANCKTMMDFWVRFGRPDLANISRDRDFSSAPVLLEIKHLAERNIPPLRNPRNVEFAKARTLTAQTAATQKAVRERKASEGPKPRPHRIYRGERRNLEFGRKPKGNTTPLERRAIFAMHARQTSPLGVIARAGMAGLSP
jgi:hypothetical protein